MMICLPEFAYSYCILEKKSLFPKIKDQKLQTMQRGNLAFLRFQNLYYKLSRKQGGPGDVF